MRNRVFHDALLRGIKHERKIYLRKAWEKVKRNVDDF
jgi:hypothetical protein